MNVKMVFLLLSYFFCVMIAISIADSNNDQWMKYKEEFNKIYDSKEEANRRQIFEQNAEKINRHNERFDKGEVLYKLGINQYTDMTENEILSLNSNSYPPTYNNEMKLKYVPRINNNEIPASFDWRNKNAVSEVKDKKNCTSDWAFTAAGALEGQLYQSNRIFTPLSAQNLIDCSGSYGNKFCTSGSVRNAVRYVRENGISTEASYPYTGKVIEENCEKIQRDGIAGDKKITINCKQILKGEESSMKWAISKRGPLAAAIYPCFEFFMYKEGIFTGLDCKKQEGFYNVLVVGYGVTDKQQKYWIVKNWLGKKWGEEGYIRIARSDTGYNTCGIADYAKIITIDTYINRI